MEDSAPIQCPTCFETFEIALDPSGGSQQSFIIDCEVCCRPMNVRVHYDPSGSGQADGIDVSSC